jgi:Tol biopolymer transport system component/DNA-binding winged helix-turn-helix (wHTH) protein
VESAPNYVSRVVSFGSFEVDLRAGELHRGGRKVKIQNQPFQILAMLLERPGEVVTRDEMRSRLWPAETFVDFDHGLNSAVRRLRDALGDSAEKPTYVETLGRRGYRFIHPVERNGSDAAEKLDGPPRAAVVIIPMPTVTEQGDCDTVVKMKSRTLAMALAAVFVSCAAAGLAYFWARPSAVPTASNYQQLTHDGREKWIVGTDGARLYLGLGLYGSQNIGEISVSGGEPRIVATPPAANLIPVDLSSNGAEVLAVDGQGAPFHGNLWSVHLPDGAPRRLGSVEGHTGSWSPDDKSLVYSNGSDIFLAKADGSEPRKLPMTKALTHVNFISWSPDGEHLRFHASEAPTSPPVLWEFSIAGGDPRRLIPGWSDGLQRECCGKWTADGRYFIFQSRGQIWALAAKSGLLQGKAKPIQLTSSPMFVTCPVPGKDGKKLFVIGQTNRGEMTRYQPATGQFSAYLGGISAEFADFSKDGQWVAYVVFPTGALWRSRVDGSERLQLTSPSSNAIMPRWSPDGRLIAYYEASPGKTARIYEVSVDGGAPRPLLPDDHGQQFDPGWSPDGSQIVFSGAGADAASTIRILDINTRQVSTLPGSQGFFSPRWSPDGRYIVALAPDTSSLHLFDFQTEKWTEVASGTGPGFPNWSKDSQFIYVFGENGTAVIRVRIPDHSIEKVADLKSFVHTGLVGRSLALAPDGSLLLLHDTGTQDVYALDWKAP